MATNQNIYTEDENSKRQNASDKLKTHDIVVKSLFSRMQKL